MGRVDDLWAAVDALPPPPPAVAGEPATTAWLAAVEQRLPGATRRLAAYGTLRPGEPNEGVVAGLGWWWPGVVRGRLGRWEGYPVLTVDRSGPAVAVDVLEGEALAGAWRRLDEFEGPAYRRALVVVELRPVAGGPATGTAADGPAVAAFAYVDASSPTAPSTSG